MSEVISRIAACIACTCFFYVGTYKSLGALQQCGYKNERFSRWLKRKDNLYYNRLALWSGLGLLSTAVVSLCFSFAGAVVARLVSAVPFFLFCLLFCAADRNYALKVPVKNTGRVKRLSAVYLLLIACVSYIVVALLDFAAAAIKSELYDLFAFLPYTLMPLLLPWLLCLANLLDGLYENPRNKKFVRRSGQILDESKIVRVAVVGSYGKTSVKNILKSILSAKYSVVETPESFNTPVGIAKTVTGPDFAGKEVLIAEMGARHVGDIAELCGLVKPDYAVFTGVCAQHVETFGSEENILKGKSEIVKSGAKKIVCGGELKEKIAALSLDVLSMSEKEKCLYADYAALISDLKLKPHATSFTLCLPDTDAIAVELPLLGKHSAENVALAALLAREMGLTGEEIARGIEGIRPVPHRLQLIEGDGVYILDDSYNANPRGAREAVEALKRFPARKIVVTPGLVETGILDEKLNGELGAALVGLDEVILVGETLVGAVKAGYLEAGGEEEKIVVLPTLDAAQARLSETLSAGDCVLFLNDLPDAW